MCSTLERSSKLAGRFIRARHYAIYWPWHYFDLSTKQSTASSNCRKEHFTKFWTFYDLFLIELSVKTGCTLEVRIIFTIYHLLRLGRPDGLLPIDTSVTRSNRSWRVAAVPERTYTLPSACPDDLWNCSLLRRWQHHLAVHSRIQQSFG